MSLRLRPLIAAAFFGFLACTLSPHALAQDKAAPAAPTALVSNGDFEKGTAGWTLFVPDESQGKNCRFDAVTDAPHSGAGFVRLQSDDFARYGIGPASGFPVQPGEHYRVVAWYKAGPAGEIRPKTPGVVPAAGLVIRLMVRQGSADAPGGAFFIGAGNAVSRGTPAESTVALPKDWTKIETVIEIPPGTDNVFPALFAWWTKGAVDVDDFSIEKVDAAGNPATASTP